VFKPEISISVKQKLLKDIPFPAITICSPLFAKEGMANYTEYKEKTSDIDFKACGIKMMYYNLTTDEKNHFSANIHKCYDRYLNYEKDYLSELLENRTEFDIVKLMEESSTFTPMLFYECIFEEDRICDGIFNRILTDSGFCYSFNLQDHEYLFHVDEISSDFLSYNKTYVNFFSPHSQFRENFARNSSELLYWTIEDGFLPIEHNVNFVPRQATVSNKMQTILVLNDEDLTNLCRPFGNTFSIIFHMPNEIPTVFHKKHHIAIDKYESLILNAKPFTTDSDLRDYSWEHRECFFQDEKKLLFFKSYTKEQCKFECMTNYTLKKCGCVKFSMPRNSTTNVCDIPEIDCYIKAMMDWPEDSKLCNCLPPCFDIEYSFVVDKSLKFYNLGKIDKYSHVKTNHTFTEIELRFDDFVTEEHEKIAIYKLQNCEILLF
jgi:amiloride-sensitive sodium channel